VIGAWLLSVITPYVFVGFGVGALAPRRGMRGTFVGIGALVLYSQAVLLLPMVIVHVHPAGVSTLWGSWIALQLSLAAAMIAAAVLGAWFGQWRVRHARLKARFP
jgi:hypothetical protein